jgi:hypothetical protein
MIPVARNSLEFPLGRREQETMAEQEPWRIPTAYSRIACVSKNFVSTCTAVWV